MTPNTFTIFLGDYKTMYLKAVSVDCFSGDPLNLSNCTEIDVALPYADGTIKHLLLSDGDVVISQPAILGKFSADITVEVSALLNVGEFQNINVSFTILGQKFTVVFSGSLSVLQAP